MQSLAEAAVPCRRSKGKVKMRNFHNYHQYVSIDKISSLPLCEIMMKHNSRVVIKDVSIVLELLDRADSCVRDPCVVDLCATSRFLVHNKKLTENSKNALKNACPLLEKEKKVD